MSQLNVFEQSDWDYAKGAVAWLLSKGYLEIQDIHDELTSAWFPSNLLPPCDEEVM